MTNSKFPLSEMAKGLLTNPVTVGPYITVSKDEKKVHAHHEEEKPEEPGTRFDLVSDAAYRFFLVPFAIFVGILAFFSGGFEAACHKSLEIINGGKGKSL